MRSLLGPVAVGPLRLRNRVVLPPLELAGAEPDGTVGERLLARCRALAGDGVLRLVETGHHYVSPEGRATARQASISRDDDLEGLRREAATVHECGSPAIVQLSHAGSAARPEVTGCRPVSASAVSCPGAKVGQPLPRALGVCEIARVADDFARAARRARVAGFDGVEVHAAHGYLLDQFLSPLTNHRTDGYGGDLEGRLRLTLEVLEAVRSEVGPGMAVSVRLGGNDYLPGGSTVDDACEAAVLLARHGCDLLSVSGGMCYYTRRDTDEPGWFRDTSAPVRRALRDAGLPVPVMLTGGIRTAADASRMVEEGACDLVGVGRAILNNRKWVRRNLGALEGPSSD